MRLIDAGAIVKCFDPNTWQGEMMIAIVNGLPTIDPVKRGKWIEAKHGVMSVWPEGQVMCSVCEQRMPSQWKKMPPYCYGCGAKMEGGGEA